MWISAAPLRPFTEVPSAPRSRGPLLCSEGQCEGPYSRQESRWCWSHSSTAPLRGRWGPKWINCQLLTEAGWPPQQHTPEGRPPKGGLWQTERAAITISNDTPYLYSKFSQQEDESSAQGLFQLQADCPCCQPIWAAPREPGCKAQLPVRTSSTPSDRLRGTPTRLFSTCSIILFQSLAPCSSSPCHSEQTWPGTGGMIDGNLA